MIEGFFVQFCTNRTGRTCTYLESGSVDGVVHVFDGLLDLELLGVELVFEFIDGG